MSEYVKGANPDPFEHAFKQLYPRLVFFAERIIQDRDVATIIVADAFLELQAKRVDFSNLESAGKILYKTIGFDCIDFLRKLSVQKRRDKKFFYWMSQQDTVELERRVDGLPMDEGMAEFMQFLKEEMPKLPPKSQSTLIDIYLNNKTARQIAKERNINESSVHDTKNNALNRLRKAFQERLNMFLFIVIIVIISLVLKKCAGK